MARENDRKWCHLISSETELVLCGLNRVRSYVYEDTSHVDEMFNCSAGCGLKRCQFCQQIALKNAGRELGC